MNPDKSHGCKWDLKAASAEVLEAIDKTVLFPKALLSSSLFLSLSLSCSPSAFGTALLRRETRISDVSDRAHRRESGLPTDRNCSLELPRCGIHGSHEIRRRTDDEPIIEAGSSNRRVIGAYVYPHPRDDEAAP